MYDVDGDGCIDIAEMKRFALDFKLTFKQFHWKGYEKRLPNAEIKWNWEGRGHLQEDGSGQWRQYYVGGVYRLLLQGRWIVNITNTQPDRGQTVNIFLQIYFDVKL